MLPILTLLKSTDIRFTNKKKKIKRNHTKRVGVYFSSYNGPAVEREMFLGQADI